MTNQPREYGHSGALGWGLLLPFVGFVSCVVSAALSAYGNLSSPIGGYVSVIFVVGLAARRHAHGPVQSRG